MACGPGHPELSKSYMDMASKLFTFTFTFTQHGQPGGRADDAVNAAGAWPGVCTCTVLVLRLPFQMLPRCVT